MVTFHFPDLEGNFKRFEETLVAAGFKIKGSGRDIYFDRINPISESDEPVCLTIAGDITDKNPHPGMRGDFSIHLAIANTEKKIEAGEITQLEIKKIVGNRDANKLRDLMELELDFIKNLARIEASLKPEQRGLKAQQRYVEVNQEAGHSFLDLPWIDAPAKYPLFLIYLAELRNESEEATNAFIQALQPNTAEARKLIADYQKWSLFNTKGTPPPKTIQDPVPAFERRREELALLNAIDVSAVTDDHVVQSYRDMAKIVLTYLESADYVVVDGQCVHVHGALTGESLSKSFLGEEGYFETVSEMAEARREWLESGVALLEVIDVYEEQEQFLPEEEETYMRLKKSAQQFIERVLLEAVQSTEEHPTHGGGTTVCTDYISAGGVHRFRPDARLQAAMAREGLTTVVFNHKPSTETIMSSHIVNGQRMMALGCDYSAFPQHRARQYTVREVEPGIQEFTFSQQWPRFNRDGIASTDFTTPIEPMRYYVTAKGGYFDLQKAREGQAVVHFTEDPRELIGFECEYLPKCYEDRYADDPKLTFGSDFTPNWSIIGYDHEDDTYIVKKALGWPSFKPLTEKAPGDLIRGQFYQHEAFCDLEQKSMALKDRELGVCKQEHKKQLFYKKDFHVYPDILSETAGAQLYVVRDSRTHITLYKATMLADGTLQEIGASPSRPLLGKNVYHMVEPPMEVRLLAEQPVSSLYRPPSERGDTTVAALTVLGNGGGVESPASVGELASGEVFHQTISEVVSNMVTTVAGTVSKSQTPGTK